MEHLIEYIESQPYAVTIHRLSETSYIKDCKNAMNFLGLSQDDPLPNIGSIGNVWRCKIGRSSEWHYGQSIADAVSTAIQESCS